MKQEIKLSQLRDSLINTFESFGYNCTDWEVWAGIHTNFADRLWRILEGYEVPKEGHLQKYPKKYKHLFGRVYLAPKENNPKNKTN